MKFIIVVVALWATIINNITAEEALPETDASQRGTTITVKFPFFSTTV
jgi:hypothetical protein